MYEDIKKQLKDLEDQLSSPEISSQPAKLIELSKKRSELKDIVDKIIELEKTTEQIKQNEEILAQENEAELKEMAKDELESLRVRGDLLSKEIEEELHPADPNDKKNVIMEIRAGTGGDESALFASDLFRMYSRFAERNGLKLEILYSSQNELGGFKEVVFSLSGKNVYGLMKYEGGVHRVQRIPETEKQGRIHTSTASVAVLPEAEEVDLEIKNEDLKIDVYRSSGPGGQSVNTTDSAVRITYLPTNLVVQCQDQKSQHQNKEKALQILRSRLMAQIEAEKAEKESANRKKQVGSGDRSEKIRTYNFPQDRLTDHRTKTTWHSINKIMDGEITQIIEEMKANLGKDED